RTDLELGQEPHPADPVVVGGEAGLHPRVPGRAHDRGPGVAHVVRGGQPRELPCDLPVADVADLGRAEMALQGPRCTAGVLDHDPPQLGGVPRGPGGVPVQGLRGCRHEFSGGERRHRTCSRRHDSICRAYLTQVTGSSCLSCLELSRHSTRCDIRSGLSRNWLFSSACSEPGAAWVSSYLIASVISFSCAAYWSASGLICAYREASCSRRDSGCASTCAVGTGGFAVVI